MGTLFISLLTLALLLISAFIVLLVLMQRTSQSGGMGAALGGGAAESAFGSETNSILMKGTIYGIVAFFVVALSLYLLYQSTAAESVQEVDLNAVVTAGESEESSANANGVLEENAGEKGTEAAATESDISGAENETSEPTDSTASETLPAAN